MFDEKTEKLERDEPRENIRNSRPLSLYPLSLEKALHRLMIAPPVGEEDRKKGGRRRERHRADSDEA